MKNMNEKEKLHRDCEPHDAAHCDINDHHNLEPGKDDCGHYVNSGPGTIPTHVPGGPGHADCDHD